MFAPYFFFHITNFIFSWSNKPSTAMSSSPLTLSNAFFQYVFAMQVWAAWFCMAEGPFFINSSGVWVKKENDDGRDDDDDDDDDDLL